MGAGAWTLTVALLGATLAFTLHAQHRAETARQAWGDTTAVWVATRPVPAGATILAADVQARTFPRSLLPSGAVPATIGGGGTSPAPVTAVVGRVALAGLEIGEVLVETRLGAADAVTLERWLTPDTVALPVPASLLPDVAGLAGPGATVTLIHRNGLVNGRVLGSSGQTASETDSPDQSGTGSAFDPGNRIRSEPTVLVGVPREQAPTLVAALLDGQLVVALISDPPRSRG